MLFFGCVYLRELLLVMKRRGILCCTFLLLFLSLLAINADNVFVNSGSVLVTEPTTRVLSYTPSDPILIQSDADFETQGWLGNGTQEDPYEISGLSIVADDIDCIKISDTAVYFRITDCFVSRVTWPDDPIIFSGIKFFNVTNGEIDNIQATHKLEGIFVEKSVNCIIKNSQLYDNVWYGCELRNSTLCTVTNCTFTENGTAGLIARITTTPPPIRDCTIVGNTFIDNDGDGIHLTYCLNFIVADNILMSNYARNIGSGIGISNYEGENCYLINNSIYESNLGIVWFGVNGTLLDNMISTSQYEGLLIRDSDNCKIENNTISICGREGISLKRSSNVFLLNNSVSQTLMSGIQFRSAINSTAIDNIIFSSAEHGILSHSGSTGNLMRSNVLCNNSLIGITLEETTSNNTVYDNRLLWNGLANALDNGTDNSWDDNVSLGNEWDDYNGIGSYPITGSAGSFDHFPKVTDTSLPEIEGPFDFLYDEGVEGQSISWNVSGAVPSQYRIYREHTVIELDAWSSGETIILDVDNLLRGVYNFTLVISDILGHEACDTVFVTVIDGSPPSLDSPDDIQFIEGTVGHIIIWHPDDIHPESFIIEVNHVVTSSGRWNSSSEEISFDLDAFTVGSYNVTLIVNDIGDNSAIDSVNVSVLPPTPTIVTTTTTTTTPTCTTTTSPTTTTTGLTSSPTTTTNESDPTPIILMSGGVIGALVIVIILLKRK